MVDTRYTNAQKLGSFVDPASLNPAAATVGRLAGSEPAASGQSFVLCLWGALDED